MMNLWKLVEDRARSSKERSSGRSSGSERRQFSALPRQQNCRYVLVIVKSTKIVSAPTPVEYSVRRFPMSSAIRTRSAHVWLALSAIAAGLVVHFAGGGLQPAVQDVIGDALWAFMMACWVGAAGPSLGLGVRGGLSLAICFGVEFSQLYHAPALDAVRVTTAGHLVLGSGFDPRDLVAYSAGVAAAVLLERALSQRRPAATR